MQPRFARYAWFVLTVNILVILWGAVVRATGAGAGCGEHWPLCNGAVVPPAPQIKTLIEYGHRLTSGLALIFVVVMLIWAFRAFPKGHIVRRMAVLSITFELTEALVGAGLVLLGHVAANQSTARGYSLAIHLTNTLLLLAALALTAWYADRPLGEYRVELRPVIAFAAFGIMLIGITGAIAALGDTLFHASSLAEGMRQDFDASSHPFVRLRLLHPIIAASLAAYLLGLIAYVLSPRSASTDMSKRLGIWLIAITVLQVSLGVVNLILMAPVPIQIGHLLLADLLWVTFILLSAELLFPVRNSFSSR